MAAFTRSMDAATWALHFDLHVRAPSILAAAFAQQMPAEASGLIFIDSTPSGARLFIDGVEVGQTPYIAPNKFQPGTTVSARIVYPGAQEWTGTFSGGVDTSFTAELQAKPE